MRTKNELSRITIEIPKTEHKKLKARAAVLGKSMKEIILDLIKKNNECIYSDHKPNKETLKSLKNIEEGKNLTKIENLDALSKKLGL